MSLKRALLPMFVLGITLLSTTVYAQPNVNCSLSAPLGPTPYAASTGHTEPIASGGNLRVTCVNNGSTGTPGVAALTISLSAGTVITNSPTHPSASTGIRLTNFGGDFTPFNVGIAAINNGGGIIVIALGNVPASGITFTAGVQSSLDLAGVLVSTNAVSGSVAAGLAASSGIAVSGGAVTVVSSIQAGLVDPTVPAALPAGIGLPPIGGPAKLAFSGTALKGDFTMRIQEGFADMLKEAQQFNGGGVFPQSPSSDVQVYVVFNNIPSGLAISGCVAVLTDVNGIPSSGAPTLSSTNVTSPVPILTVNFNAPLSLSNIDVLWVSCQVAAGTAILPLPLTPVNAKITLGPVGQALGPTGNVLTTLIAGQVPRYAQHLQPAADLPVVQFVPDPPPGQPPVITSIVPAIGTQGTFVNATITGTNMLGVTEITFSGTGVFGNVIPGGTDTAVPVFILIDPQAQPGTRTVTVTAGTLSSTPFSGFKVKKAPLALGWGSNTIAQMARLNPQSNLSPGAVMNLGAGSGVVSIAASPTHSLALKSDGTVLAWGSNTSGQLGDGTLTPKLVPVPVTGLGAGSGVIAIAAGNVYSMALKSDGTVLAWGNNNSGQLGDGTIVSKSVPTPVSGLGAGSGVTAIATGSGSIIGSHSLVLKSDGSVWAWGLNSNGQLGDGTTAQKLVPTQVHDTAGTGFLSGMVGISAGGSFSLAVRSDGTVWAWGLNTGGQLGDATMTQRLLPVQTHDPTNTGFFGGAVAISAGSTHSLALKSDGTVWAWGNGVSGQLGDSNFIQRSLPVQTVDSSGIGFLTSVVSISAGSVHSLAVKADGSGFAWGAGGSGQLGDGTTTVRAIPGPIGGITPLGGILKTSAGSLHSLALSNDGAVFAWGSNGGGQLGNGVYDGNAEPLAIESVKDPFTLPKAIAAAPGGSQSLLVKSDNTMLTWGANATNLPTPVFVPFPGDVAGVAVGSFLGATHNLALLSDGTVLAWGSNNNGQLGDGTTFPHDAALQVGSFGPGSGVIAIAAGGSYSLALTFDGVVWAWGSNASGQLGDGTTQQKTSPVQVTGFGSGSGVVAIAAGVSFSLALKSDGTVWSWGTNLSGQLGDGSTVQKTVPVQVRDVSGLAFLSGVARIAAGNSHTLALKADGTVLAWGLNLSGQLGDGSITNRSIPVAVSGLGPGSNVMDLRGGGSHSLALTSSGGVWAWGSNVAGQLGDGTLENRRTPVQVVLKDGVAIAAGSTHSLAIGLPIPKDATPPLIMPTVTGTAGSNGWYRSNVTVTWAVSDPESDIDSTTGCSSTTLTTDTAGIKLTCTATNGAGLMASASVTVKIDRKPPALSGMPAANCTIQPPDKRIVQIAAVTMTDAGVATLSVKVTSNEPVSAGDIVVTGGVVKVRADRLQNGNGRIYTVTAQALDIAGNASTAVGTCTVPK